MNDIAKNGITDSDEMLAYCLSVWKQSFDDYFPYLDDMENRMYPSGARSLTDIQESIDAFYVSAVNGVMDSWEDSGKHRYCQVIKISLGMEPHVYHFNRVPYDELLRMAHEEMKVGLRKRNVVI